MVYRIEKTTRTVIYLKKAILIRSGSTKNYPIRNIKCTGKEEKINSLREGMHVRLEGMLVLPELPRNPGQFNRRIYESGKKIDFYLENPTVLEVKEQRSGVREVVEIWKTEMMNRCEKIYPDAEAGILEAMLFGEKRELSGDIKELSGSGNQPCACHLRFAYQPSCPGSCRDSPTAGFSHAGLGDTFCWCAGGVRYPDRTAHHSGTGFTDVFCTSGCKTSRAFLRSAVCAGVCRDSDAPG